MKKRNGRRQRKTRSGNVPGLVIKEDKVDGKDGRKAKAKDAKKAKIETEATELDPGSAGAAGAAGATGAAGSRSARPPAPWLHDYSTAELEADVAQDLDKHVGNMLNILKQS